MGNNGKVERALFPFMFNGKEYRMMPRERLFALAYCQNGGNLSQAVYSAGYNAKNSEVAGSTGSEIIRRPRVYEFIKAVQDDIATMLGISAIDIAREYAKIGFSDFRKVFDPETGQILEAKDLDDNTGAAVASYEVLEVYEPRTGKFIGKNKKLKFHNKIDALDKLARMIGVDAKMQSIVPVKPEPLQITIKHSKAKISKKDGNNGTVPGIIKK